MRIQEDSRSMVRNMGSSGVFVALALSLLLFEPASCQGGGGSLTSPGAVEVSTPVGAAGGGAVDLPIPIPTSLRFYEGADLNIDSCPRDEVSVNGSCHRVLTQGPCQDSDFVLLDPSTHEGYCAARLCAPDRIFVFSDQLCHDPFSSTHCPGSQELFQTAFGTPICQCPDGFLEGAGGSCVPPLTPTHTCPPAQVLWSNSSRLMQVCGPDPCGRLNLDRPLPSPPFVPSLADGICYQLGQVSGVCPQGSFYALDLEARRGVCAVLQDAGYVILDAATQRLYRDLYGPFSLFTLLDPSLLLPAPPLPPTHLGQDPVALLTGAPHTPLSLDGGQAQQSGGLVLPGLAGQGAATLDATKGGVVTQITFGSVAVPGALEQHAAAHQGAARPGKRPPHPRNHYIRGHNLGPVRDYKFSSLSKHFLPTPLDLARLHATRGQNHLVRPIPAKGLPGATPALRVQVVPARLLAETLYVHHARPTPRHAAHSETQEAEDELESAEHQDKYYDSTADAQPADETDAQGEETDTAASRRRRAAQGAGLVETRLVTCRAGARRHVNAKCRHTLLPFSSLSPATLHPTTLDAAPGVLRRRRRSATPLPPAAACPQCGASYDFKRQCVLTLPASASPSALQ